MISDDIIWFPPGFVTRAIFWDLQVTRGTCRSRMLIEALDLRADSNPWILLNSYVHLLYAG
eukprot:SAG22_NODE_396_length_11127_cov_33.460011_12_plen_61_part_00